MILLVAEKDRFRYVEVTMIEFIGDSHLRGAFAPPERASYYQFRTDAGRLLTVAWHSDGWVCVNWQTCTPAKPADYAEGQDMREAERQAAAMWSERHAARNGGAALRLVA